MAGLIGGYSPSLIAGANVVAGNGGGGPWTPAMLSPALWIEARSGVFQSNAGTTAATANSDPVGFITDLSGNGFHLSSTADDTTRPLLQGVGANPYLDFDGSNDCLRRAASLGMFSAGSVSIFAALRANPASNGHLLNEGNSGNSNQVYQLFNALPGTPTSRTQFIRTDDNVLISASGNTPSFFNNSDQVLGVTDDGSNLIPYIDSAAQTTRTYTRSGSFTFNIFGLGALVRNTISLYFQHRLYGLVIVNGAVLSGTDRALLITYLGALQGRTL
jgi:hypothetical protein